jgi:hypothetical protein
VRVVHENEPLVRRLFSDVIEMAISQVIPERIEFPFAALLVTAGKDITAVFCEPAEPLFFIYPELSADKPKTSLLRVTNPSAGFLTVSHFHTAGPTFREYLSGVAHNWWDSALQGKIKGRRYGVKYTFEGLREEVLLAENLVARLTVEKIVEWYRKFKYSFFDGEEWRKEVDSMVSKLDKFDGVFCGDCPTAYLASVLLYQFRTQMFSFFSTQEGLLHLLRHRVMTGEYFLNGMAIWPTTSFNECNTTYWVYEYQPHMKHQEHNSSCVYAAMRALNLTYVFVKEHGAGTLESVRSPKRTPLASLLHGYKPPPKFQRDV